MQHSIPRRLVAAAVLSIAFVGGAVMLFSQHLNAFQHVFAPYYEQSTVIFDAGHGGVDGGATAADGTSEKDINLSIVYKCKDLAELFGVPVLLTRTDENSIDYDPNQTIRQNKVTDIHARERITKEAVNPIFISVHLNKYPDTSYSGAQVFWSKNNLEGQLLAQQIQQSFTDGTAPVKQRQAKQAPDSIYLMKQLTCPAVIAECGFLSNAAEAEQLKQDSYQTKLALCIIHGYLNYLEEE